MANLEFRDTYNMVAYLLKTEGSEGFHQIVDFLNSSHLKYALTKNPTIYTSLIQQFWQTASANTLDIREVQITATIYGKVKLVSEASISSHLKLEDSDGIIALPNTEIFKQLALIGSPTHTRVADEAASTGVDVRHGGAATTVSSLDTGQGSGNSNKTPSMPYDLPLPKVHILRSDEGRMQHNELMDPVTKLTDRVLALEKDLQQTKKDYSTTVTKLIMKDVAQDTSKQWKKIDAIDQDPNISLVQHDAEVQGSHEHETEFETEDISTAKTLVYIRRSASKDKGKRIMIESEPKQTFTKLQQRQERVGYEVAVRLQEQLDEEERQRIAMVHEEASSFNVEEWEGIQAIIEADEELALRIQAEEREKSSEAKKERLLIDLINRRKRHFAQQRAAERRNKPMTQAQQRTYMSNYIADESSKRAVEEELEQESSKRQKTGEISEPREKEDDELTQEDLQQMMMMVPVKEVYVEALQVKYPIIDWELYIKESRKYWKIIRVGNHTESYQIFVDMLKKFDRDDMVKLWDLVKERFSTTEPTDDKEKEL
nr:hypothetical protein [Tanacetum cinerariifolium]